MVQRICFFVLFSLSLFSRIAAQDRAPHGLAYQSPATALSPTAYEFFHPNAHQDPCTKSNCAPIPLAAQVHEMQSEAATETSPITRTTAFGAGTIAGPAFAAIIVLCLAIGIYYVAKTRQENVNRTKPIQPDV
ncbi:uncharacterized protein LOC110695418 [Chenopodium quinoa]|uniref:Transmembrane protein n=1 Tax=Chenopodium quinoa TaxID=63459 RepID=A0A803N337_CHEQI|nr:uncharacterized protein LOC110695418 [Chenopodium quinoa]